MIVADTDVLIDFLADHGPAAAAIAAELTRGRLATTVLTRFELLAGARSAKARQAIAALLGGLPTLPLDSQAADLAADVRRRLEAGGQSIGMADSLIAGIVLTQNAALMTRNRRHFDRVPGLALIDP